MVNTENTSNLNEAVMRFPFLFIFFNFFLLFDSFVPLNIKLFFLN